MIDTDKLTKHYYTTSEVADMFDVSNSLIRYWETEFSSLRPSKTSKGERRFTKKNIEQIATIFHLVKEKGFTLEGARREMAAQKTYQKERKVHLKKLRRIREGLDNLKEELEDLSGGTQEGK